MTRPTKSQRSKPLNVISEQETSDISKSNETNDNLMLSVIKEEEISLFSERSEWEHFSELEDMISYSSDNDYCHRNFRKTVYIYFCHIFQFRKAK